ncbi:unnamed protein product [Bursaphelenchus okinawaensis]|uniref:ShKT domain-containing protein n=1 Tax=Bursaphelenchus okinawaensis TaxID=465554 RepID=A0A811L506_9BILA|nr:unnamed protein product [Bursaphelenchus okinawaensis]CAG9117566.1 unnamed protein product [Bursaphelenchus okinawaensis]
MYKNSFLIVVLTASYYVRLSDAQCANALGPCIANECPNMQDAGQNYVCIQDTCCPPSSSNCQDGAINCQMFTQECFTPMYQVCMNQHCRRSCGICQ